MDRVDIIVTCRLGMEKIVASYIKDIETGVEILPAPFNFMGLILVAGSRDRYRLADEIKRSVPEVEKIYIVDAIAKSDIQSIVDAVKRVVQGAINPNESFAVRTVRRGRHSFTSIDVNIAVGSIVKDVTGARVDLDNPDKVVFIQIIQDYAYISIVPGKEIIRKMKPYKFPMYKLFRRFVVVHEPYLGPEDASYTMGVRIGREVQTYEVGELVVAPIGSVDAYSMYHFLRGLFEGIESRYDIQRKSYGREVHRVRVSIQDMYQFIRSHMGEPIIVFEPEGEPISKLANEVSEFIVKSVKAGKKIYMMIGAREGIPTGLFRYASYVLDIAPGIVISTDYALASALIAITTVLHEKLSLEREEIEKTLDTS
ncbi:THUMP domain protein [Ignisphaera aggregans DSM 17230]|uniref:THUMP domain protein n=1 Tax=Ignisphaera aggregans (strain DSM 17230 / JCM 13409 / AQ1.S1) TaxID=583356 RepID=E0SSC1_IGNAA|nr:THUMP domain protein [Ignisphaera aggregans DSM 17230]